jgi:hypothetical protein
MLIKSVSRVAMATALIFAFSACGSDSSGGTDFDDSATTGDTEDMAEGSADLATEIASAMDFGSPQIFVAAPAALAAFTAKHPMARQSLLESKLLTLAPRSAQFAPQLSAAAGCTLEGHGADGSDPFEPYDGNANGIPDDWAVKVVCVSVDSSDTAHVWTYTQKQELSVKENGAAIYGYDAAMVLSLRATDDDHNSEGIDFKGSDALDLRGTSAAHHFSFSAREYETFDGVTDEDSGGESWDASFDPDGTIVIGDPLPDGILAFTGKNWYANSDDVSLSFTLDTPTSLLYSAACAEVNDNPPFTQGVIRGRLNGHTGSATFTVTMTDCGVYTVATEHTDDPVVSAHP